MPETKPETPDEEVFTRKEKKHPWTAKPLTLEGTARLIQLLGGIMADAAQQAQVQELITPEGEIRSGFSSLLSVLGKEQLSEFLSIVTGRSPRWVTRNFSLVGASRAVGEFLKNENLGDVLKNLRPTAWSLPATAEAVGDDGSQGS